MNSWLPEDISPGEQWDKAYLAIPVQGERHEDSLYLSLAEAIQNAGVRIVNRDVVTEPPADLDDRYAATAIFEENLERLRAADVIIAEVSSPSLGVGYEIGVAEQLNLPVVGLWRFEKHKPSKMLLGNQHFNLNLFEYASVEYLTWVVSLALAWSSELHRIEKHGRDERERIKEHFRELAPDYDSTTQWRRNERLETWFSSHIPSGSICLDVGSGTGVTIGRAVDRVERLLRVDLSGAMLRQREVGESVTGVAEELPFGTETVDVGVIRQVLHYVEEGRVLREMKRVLRKSGVLLVGQVIAPDDRTCRWWLELKRMVQPLRKTFYSRSGLKRMLASSGFMIQEEKVLYLQRSDPWSRFVTNVPTFEGKKLVRSYLELVPPDIQQHFNLKVSDDTVAYRQMWLLAACVPK